MTSTAYDDQFTPATQTILRVNVIESQQQIHDLQTRLAAAIERATAAEAELAKMREQKPVAWCDPIEFKDDPWSFQGFRCRTNNYPTMPLYAAPVPAPAVPYGVDEEAAYRISLAVYDWKKGINPEPLLYAINRILATETHPLSDEGQRSLLQSAEAQAGDKWQLTPATTHPVDRNAGKVRHD